MGTSRNVLEADFCYRRSRWSGSPLYLYPGRSASRSARRSASRSASPRILVSKAARGTALLDGSLVFHTE